MWHKAEWIVHPMRLELTRVGLLVKLANRYTTRGALLHRNIGEGVTPFPGLLQFTLDTDLIILSVKQGGIKYHFLSLWYDSTWDWTPVFRVISETLNSKL